MTASKTGSAQYFMPTAVDTTALGAAQSAAGAMAGPTPAAKTDITTAALHRMLASPC